MAAGAGAAASRGPRRVIASRNDQGLVTGGTIVHADGTTETLCVDRNGNQLEILVGGDDDDEDDKPATRRKAPRKKGLNMATRMRTIYPAVNGFGVPNVLGEAGLDPAEGVGLGFLEVIRPKCEAWIRSGNNPNAEEEIAGLRVYGVEHLRVAGPDVLTPLEDVSERLAAAEAKLAQLRGLYHADGTPLPDALDRLRRIAGV